MAVILHPRSTQTFSHFLFDMPDMESICAFPPMLSREICLPHTLQSHQGQIRWGLG